MFHSYPSSTSSPSVSPRPSDRFAAHHPAPAISGAIAPPAASRSHLLDCLTACCPRLHRVAPEETVPVVWKRVPRAVFEQPGRSYAIADGDLLPKLDMLAMVLCHSPVIDDSVENEGAGIDYPSQRKRFNIGEPYKAIEKARGLVPAALDATGRLVFHSSHAAAHEAAVDSVPAVGMLFETADVPPRSAGSAMVFRAGPQRFEMRDTQTRERRTCEADSMHAGMAALLARRGTPVGALVRVLVPQMHFPTGPSSTRKITWL